MTINNELLFHFANPGKCWHERENTYGSVCILCGATLSYTYTNLSYSTSPADRERLWLYLVGKEMWKEFDNWAWEQSGGLITTEYVPWLTLPLDGVPRWVSLLSEWLGLEEVREKFGTTECPCPPEFKGDEEIERVCPYCSGTGKIRAEWAKEE